MKVGHAWFPIEWDFGDKPSDGLRGGKPPDDPMTIYAGPDEDDHPKRLVSFSLREVIEIAIESTLAPDGITGQEHVPSMVKIRDGLRELADAITARLPPAV